MPARNPIATRSSGEIRLCSNEYFTKKATPRKRANPPIQANIFAPMNCSQSMVRAGGGAVSICTSSTGVIGCVSGIGGGTAVTGKGGGTETDGMIGAADFGCVTISGGVAGASSLDRCRRASSISSRCLSSSIAREARLALASATAGTTKTIATTTKNSRIRPSIRCLVAEACYGAPTAA